MISVDPGELERARLELRAMVRKYLFNPDYSINLIDFGFAQRGKLVDGKEVRYWDKHSLALRFHVTQKFSLDDLERLEMKVLPQRIGPFATDVIEADYTTRLPGAIPSGARVAPRPKLCGGLGISAFRDTSGTLGGIVRHRETRELFLMSNWHVLYYTRNTRAGQPIYQPIMHSYAPTPPIVARVAHERLSAPGATQLPLDVAVARLNDQSAWENFQIGLGRVSGVARARLGMQVVKSGLTSGITRGVVSGIEGFSKLVYDLNWPRMIERVVVISRSPLYEGEGHPGTEPVSMEGDSGSWWLDEATRQAVALNFAGRSDGGRAMAIDLPFVLDEMHMDLADNGA